MTGSKWWREQAACRLEVAGMFDPPVQTNGQLPADELARVRAAVAICRSCAAQAPCEAEARRQDDSGVRGGLLFHLGAVVDYKPAPDKSEPSPCIDCGRMQAHGPTAVLLGVLHGTGVRCSRCHNYHMNRRRNPAVDSNAVDRAITGETVRLSTHERRQAVRRLTENGHSATFIAELLGITKRSVTRNRSASNSVSGAVRGTAA